MMKHIFVALVLFVASLDGHHVHLHEERNHALPVSAHVAR